MRKDKLIEYIDKNSVLYITAPEDMRYYSGFTGEGAVVIAQNENYILTDGRYIEKAQQESDFEVIDSVNHLEFLKKLGKKIIIQPESIVYAKVNYFSKNGLKLIVENIDFDSLRSIKDACETENMRKAAAIAEKAFSDVLSEIKENATEKQIAAKLDYLMMMGGAEKTSFDTICVSGVNSSLPHGVPSDKQIKNGEFVTMDFGCMYNGYCSDMTRTVAVGNVSQEMKNVYETVKNAQIKAQESVRAGITAKSVDDIARGVIKDAGYGDYFIHSTGHGVGLKIHEKPNVTYKNEKILQKGNAITVEPGIYLPGKFGVRIENTVIVTENGSESLQKFKKDLIIL